MKPVGCSVDISVLAKAPSLRKEWTTLNNGQVPASTSALFHLFHSSLTLRFQVYNPTAMKDTDWIRVRMISRFGSLDGFAAAMRARQHTLITGDILGYVLAGILDVWSDEAALMAALLGCNIGDLHASLCLARIDQRYAISPAAEEERLELVS